MGYRCDHFKIQELVTPEIFKARGDMAWDLLDAGLLRTLDLLRNRYGAAIINNWADGGDFKESGMRNFLTTTGANWSMHKFGRAADPKFKQDSAEIQADILKNGADFPLLTCMENAAFTKGWNHVDTRNHNQPQQIILVNP